MENNLKSIRKYMGITQNRLAMLTGFTQGQISNWEHGKDMELMTAHKFAVIFNCKIDDLFIWNDKNRGVE